MGEIRKFSSMDPVLSAVGNLASPRSVVGSKLSGKLVKLKP